MYISEIIDNKLKQLKGEYSYKKLLSILRYDLISYSTDEAENFVRQSIYRLKREGIVYKEGGIFLFNSNKKWTPSPKTSLSELINLGVVAAGKSSLLYKYKMIEQIPARKFVIVQRRHGNIKNDIGAVVGYTTMEFNSDETKLFEMAKIFELIGYSESDYKEVYKVINANNSDVQAAIIDLKKFISKQHILKYDRFVSWFSSRLRRFDE